MCNVQKVWSFTGMMPVRSVYTLYCCEYFFRQSYLILCVQNKTYNFKEEKCMYRCIYFVYTYTVRTHVSRRIEGETNIKNRPLLLSRVSYFYAFRLHPTVLPFKPVWKCTKVKESSKRIIRSIFSCSFFFFFFFFVS